MHQGGGGFWVSPETGKPGAGVPRSRGKSPPHRRVTSVESRSSGGGGGISSPRGSPGSDVSNGTTNGTNETKGTLSLWSTRVAPAVTSLRGAFSRGPTYRDGPADTAAPPLADARCGANGVVQGAQVGRLRLSAIVWVTTLYGVRV